ncbi:hypothetical protein BDV36DRAFT_278631 [Aspergillus pseudocaelatus]|uniref:C2 domain-containing protein n=1 Tax=Aspergillus pseudocaelatus TaxID=1825620 RepID=A0ABQ6VZJ1_9EURO|nr:hypothetical protein BDV36DRAFT_278631 [Aspergillus pseudocaelatus]
MLSGCGAQRLRPGRGCASSFSPEAHLGAGYSRGARNRSPFGRRGGPTVQVPNRGWLRGSVAVGALMSAHARTSKATPQTYPPDWRGQCRPLWRRRAPTSRLAIRVWCWTVPDPVSRPHGQARCISRGDRQSSPYPMFCLAPVDIGFPLAFLVSLAGHCLMVRCYADGDGRPDLVIIMGRGRVNCRKTNELKSNPFFD